MKKQLSIFFLALYAITVFSSLLPYLEYAINYDYISTVLCENKDKPEMHCNGKCHLKKQIEKVVKSQIPSEENEDTPVLVSSRDFSPAILHKYAINISIHWMEIGKFKSKEVLYSKEIYHSIFHPPTFA